MPVIIHILHHPHDPTNQGDLLILPIITRDGQLLPRSGVSNRVDSYGWDSDGVRGGGVGDEEGAVLY